MSSDSNICDLKVLITNIVCVPPQYFNSTVGVHTTETVGKTQIYPRMGSTEMIKYFICISKDYELSTLALREEEMSRLTAHDSEDVGGYLLDVIVGHASCRCPRRAWETGGPLRSLWACHVPSDVVP